MNKEKIKGMLLILPMLSLGLYTIFHDASVKDTIFLVKLIMLYMAIVGVGKFFES